MYLCDKGIENKILYWFLNGVIVTDQAYIYLTDSLAASCMVFAMIFLTLPMPKKEGLRNYRISLRFLAVAYVISACVAVVDKTLVNVLSMIFLSMCSFLTLLFTTALINLLHPERITRTFVLWHAAPLVAVNAVYWLVAMQLGNPILRNMEQVVDNVSRPQVMMRIATWMACAVQLGYSAILFRNEILLYKSRLNECFSEDYKLNLPWVGFCYCGMLLLGVYALGIVMVSVPAVVMTFFLVLAAFFVLFGVCYIQYPRTYVKIEKVFVPNLQHNLEHPSKRRYSWPHLKQQVIDHKYYLNPGINIEEMAELLQIGRTTLSGFVNKEEQMNFNAWVGSLRVEEAIRIFSENPQFTIAQVSEMVGYSEPSNFSRQFKNKTGVSPSEWYRHQQMLA